MPDIVGIVKRAAIEAVEASKPVNLLFGTVASVAPLTIQVDQKTILTAAMLILCESVVDHWEDVTVSLADENNVKVTGGRRQRFTADLPLARRFCSRVCRAGRNSPSSTG